MSAESSSASQRTSPTVRLPTEILGDIVDRAATLPYKDRQATLHSLCLASRTLRRFAQPLLLARIHVSGRSETHDERGYPTRDTDDKTNDLLQLLVNNNTTEALASIKSIRYDVPSLKNVTSYLRKLRKAASGLEDLYVEKKISNLRQSFGMNIKTLSLKDVTWCQGSAPMFFPNLENLSMIQCPMDTDPVIRFILPKLRHFQYHNHRRFYPQETEFLRQIIPTLVSFSFRGGISLELGSLPPCVSSTPSLSVLFEAYILSMTGGPLEGVRNLRILFHKGNDFSTFKKWTKLIRTSMHRLELLILAPWPSVDAQELASVPEVAELKSLCREVGIEVVWEENAGPYWPTTYHEGVSRVFIEKAEAHYEKVTKTQ